MLTKRDRTAGYKQLQELQRLRADNIRYWRDRAGGWAQLARLSGESIAWLTQLAGDNPSRQVSERVARKLEENWGLTPGWLDERH
jgi:hypothetical protein